MSSIINKLAPFFNRRDNEELNAIVKSVDSEILETSSRIDDYMLELYISSANGKWLEQWGLWFGVTRNQYEKDEELRKRILNSLSSPSVTIPAIKSVIREYMGNGLKVLEVYEPFNNLRKYSISTFSGNDHYANTDYWRHGVIDIQTSEELPEELKKMIDYMKGSGIKVHYNIVEPPKEEETPVIPPDNIEDFIDTAKSEWLDMCGKWFGVVRNEGEGDISFRERIKEAIKDPSVPIPSIVAMIKMYLEDNDAYVEVYEPKNELRKYNSSTFSGKGRYRDNTYWNERVMDIRTEKELSTEIKEIINLIKDPNITIYYTVVTNE